jgi:uncharacterized protein
VKYFALGSTYVVRLEPDERIVETLTGLCEREGIGAGYFHGLGAVSRAELGHFEPAAGDYIWMELEGPWEIVSLYGNVAVLDGQPFVHAHAVLSDRSFAVRGGHLREAVVSATCEIALIRPGGEIGRKKDAGSGLFLLDLDKIGE